MRCINKILTLHHQLTAGFFLLLSVLCLTGCGKLEYSLGYDSEAGNKLLDVKEETNARSDAFATNLCIATNDLLGDGKIDLSTSEAAVLFDINQKEVLYSKNAHETLYPASLTKTMTALVAIKYGTLDQVLTASDAVVITENGAQVAGIKPGDSMTLYQALRILLLHSANDVANLIAENIGGSVDEFVALMNKEALALGATNTHFANANGLTDEAHYTTAYDLYLIFNECIKYDEFLEIISMSSYETTYTSGSKEKTITVKNTNGYISGYASSPVNVSIIGGKTGTTSAAGHCLILLTKDVNGNPYISVVLKSESSESLYSDMTALLSEVNE